MKGGWAGWLFTAAAAIWVTLGPLVAPRPQCRCMELWLTRDAGRDVGACPLHGPL